MNLYSGNLGRIITGFVFFSCAIVFAQEYVVKAGDTLSQIAQEKIPGHVYGRNGSLRKLRELNQEIANRDDKIVPGETIIISHEPELKATATEPQLLQLPRTIASEPIANNERSVLEFAPRFSFTRLDAKDKSTGGNSTLGSNLSVGGELKWEQFWSSNWMSSIEIGFDHFQEQSTGKNLSNVSFSSGFIDLNFGYEFSHDWSLSLGLGAEQAPFIRADSTSSIAIDSVDIPKIHLGFTKSLAQTNLFNLKFGLGGGVRLPVSQENYDVKTGYEVGAYLDLHQLKGSVPLYSRIYFSESSQDTSITKQSESILGLALGLSFDVGGKP